MIFLTLRKIYKNFTNVEKVRKFKIVNHSNNKEPIKNFEYKIQKLFKRYLYNNYQDDVMRLILIAN